MAEEVVIGNVGGDGVASEVTLARLLAAMEKMGSAKGGASGGKEARAAAAGLADAAKSAGVVDEAFDGAGVAVKDATKKVNRFAFEISPSRKSYLNHLGIKVLNDFNIKNYNNYFDYIRLEQVLEHIPDLNTCMILIKKLSKKNTILEVGVPDGKKLIQESKFITITKGPIQPLEHLNCFSNQSLKKFMMKYDFEPINFSDIFSLYFNKSLFTLTGVRILIIEVLNNFFSTTIKFKNKI